MRVMRARLELIADTEEDLEEFLAARCGDAELESLEIVVEGTLTRETLRPLMVCMGGYQAPLRQGHDRRTGPPIVVYATRPAEKEEADAPD